MNRAALLREERKAECLAASPKSASLIGDIHEAPSRGMQK
jgi:hypothetical protein